MGVDLDYLKSKGVSSGAYKEIFTKPVLEDNQARCLETITDRIRTGIETCLRDYRLYWAIDLAHETPFSQINPTMIRALLSKNLTAKETLEELGNWGLSEADLFISVDELGSDGKPTGNVKKVLNAPVFFEVLIPIVRAYHFAKTARLYNPRDTSPLFKYTPARNTSKDSARAQIVTGMVAITSQWYGYSEYLKQAIQQMLKYGVCIAFPKERWHKEKQETATGEVKIQKEGLRYNLPHPSRMAFDLHHPTPTINTDTGVEWGFYWDISRYGDVLDDKMLWNREAITYGTNWMDKPAYRQYFKEVYPCTMRFPTVGSDIKREDKAAFYSQAQRDMAVTRTEMFWKLVPSDYGLGDYDYPVWHRFSVASDTTVLWAEPFPYNPMWFMGYDWDSQAGTPSSFSLETIPWQDHLGFLLSQMVLTAKQNLQNIVFADLNVMKESDIRRIEQMPQKERYASAMFIRYDSLKLARSNVDARAPFFSPPFQYKSIVELQSMLSTALSLMERVLQITAQEVGATAAHYQSAAEVKTVAMTSDNRTRFTGSGIDSGIDAWKRQLYVANMAFRNDDIEAHVTADIPNLRATLQELGFSIVGDDPDRKLVGGKKGTLDYLEIARENVEPGENTDPQSAQVIFQTIGVIAQNPEFLAAVGTQRIVRLLEQAAKFAGAPDDFDISSTITEKQPGPAFMQQLAPVLQQLQQTITQQIGEGAIAPMAQKLATQEQQTAQLTEAVKSLQGIFDLVKNLSDKANVKAQEVQTQIQLDAATSAAEQQRLDQEFQANQARLNAEHQAQMQRDAEQAQLDAALTAQKTAADIEAKQTAAAASAAATKAKAKP